MIKLQYHHIGIPTDEPLPKGDYSEEYKLEQRSRQNTHAEGRSPVAVM